ncbi:MAG: hypothetical protein AAGF94_16820 [Pseudomonadota bacterium]
MTSPYRKALSACFDLAATEGKLDLGLRAYERGTGISARMLTHHFGGNAGLKAALVEEIEARLREEVTATLNSGEGSALEIAKSFAAPDKSELRRLLRAILRDALGGNEASAAVLAAERAKWRAAIDSSNVEQDLFVLVGGAVDAMLADAEAGQVAKRDRQS